MSIHRQLVFSCFFLHCFCWLFFSELYEKDFNGQTAIYWEVKYPFPLSNRDVSFWATQTHSAHREPKRFERHVRLMELRSGYDAESVFPNSSNLSMCTWGSGETWMWTAGRSGWSWPGVLRRHRVQKRVACCGSKTTSRASPWRAMEPEELKVTRQYNDTTSTLHEGISRSAEIISWLFGLTENSSKLSIVH